MEGLQEVRGDCSGGSRGWCHTQGHLASKDQHRHFCKSCGSEHRSAELAQGTGDTSAVLGVGTGVTKKLLGRRGGMSE